MWKEIQKMNEKLYSGKFYLCIIAGLCLLGLSLTVCRALWLSDGSEVNSGIAAALGMLNTLLTAIITHYFTKQVKP